MILKFRMLSDENDNFVRDFEVRPEMTLAKLHEFILGALDYDDCIASFFSADDRWNRLHEYTSVDMGETGSDTVPTPMSETTLAEVIIGGSERLVYQFDLLSDRAYYLSLVDSSKPNPALDYPRVAFEHASAPDQYDPGESLSDEGSIFDEMMGDFSDFEGCDDYDDEY